MEVQSRNIISLNSSAGEIPLELDFFKYAQGSHSKRKSPDSTPQEGKRRKFHHEATDEIDTTQAEEKKSSTVHRVAAKGKDVPPHVESFAALKAFSIPPHLLSNLASSGYTEPTSVQSYCLPILLKVIVLAFVARLQLTFHRIGILWLSLRQVQEKHWHTLSQYSQTLPSLRRVLKLRRMPVPEL